MVVGMSTEIEVVAPLDVAAATRLDKRIRLMASTVRENLVKIAELVDEAKAGQVHVALGFSSWTAYLADAIGGQIELSTDSRRAVVELLAGEGMSNRAIAAAVGVTEGTVRNDKVRSDYAPEPVTGLDGKTYSPRPWPKLTREPERDPEPDPVEDDVDEAFINAVLDYGASLNAAENAQPEPATVVENTTVEHQQQNTLRTWYRGKFHEFASPDDLYAALSVGCISVGTVQAVLGNRGAVKISASEADELRDNMFDLHVALLVLLEENRRNGDEILAQSDELDRRAVEIVKDLFATVPAEQIEEEPADGDTYTLWSPDVTITVTSRISYEDLRPWVLSLYRHTADCDCHPWWDYGPNAKFGDPLGRFSKWLAAPEDCPELDVFGATCLYLDPLFLITNMATWIAEEFGGDSIKIVTVLLDEYRIWDIRVSESIKKRNTAGGDLGE